MHAQFPTATTVNRGPAHALLAGLVALAVAGGTVGIVAITSDDGTTAQSPSPVIAKVAPDRVLDGSPILRGTATQPHLYPYRHAIAPASLRKPAVAGSGPVLDGSPILRGHAAAAAVIHESSVQGTLRPPESRPLGFGYRP